MGLLRGDSLAWATAAWENQTLIGSFISSFVTKMRKMFDYPVLEQMLPNDFLLSAKDSTVWQSIQLSLRHMTKIQTGLMLHFGSRCVRESGLAHSSPHCYG